MLRPPRSTRTETRFPCTTLFRSDTAAVRVAWLTLERDDRDLKRFVNYLLLALQRNGTDDDAWGASSDLPPRAALSAIINRSEEPTSELQSLMRISYAVFCLQQKNHTPPQTPHNCTHHTTTL